MDENSLNIIISSINHSKLPCIIVEGESDVKIYRWILEEIGLADYFFPANITDIIKEQGGCSTLRELYLHRNRITNPNVLFISDKDIYVYSQIPQKYDGIIFTKGYSIENDLYEGCLLEQKLFEKEDKQLFNCVLEEFIRYYACEFQKYHNGEKYNLRKKPESIIDKEYKLNSSLLENFFEPSKEIVDYFKNQYDLLLRGHSLFKLVGMVLHRKKRDPKYSESALYELCYKFCQSQSIKEMQEKIKEKFDVITSKKHEEIKNDCHFLQ
ncbi:MAG: hypothetical protein MSS84_01080 [Bacteroidales bacterium]|nr:hypothetical protein [Bacteroidales bacterium]